MREIKLPHLPSDVEARKEDLIDLWYKNKETQIKQDASFPYIAEEYR